MRIVRIGRSLRLGCVAGLLAGAGCAPEPFALVGHDFGAAAGVKLDQPLRLSFNDEVDPATLREASLRVARVRDGALVPGVLHAEGATVVFTPRLPRLADLSDGGLQPGERYRVELFGLPLLRTLRGLRRGALADGRSLELATVRLDATRGETLADAPAERLFADAAPGAPELLRSDAILREGGCAELRFSEPLDPRSLARTRFWLRGPWSRASHPTENPVMSARLVENQASAVVELRLETPPPSPLIAGGDFEVEIEAAVLRDLGGHPLQKRGVSQFPFVKLQVER